MPQNNRTILIICTGNSCRSVMAEGLLKKYLRQAGKGDIKVISAGVLPASGLVPTQETVEVMKEEGIDVSGYRSKNLSPELIKRADIILVMEAIHREEVLNKVPEAKSKTFLLKEFGVPGFDKNGLAIGIRDPIARPIDDYRLCLNMIKKEIERIVKIL